MADDGSFEVRIKGRHTSGSTAEDMAKQFTRRLSESGASISEATIETQGRKVDVRTDPDQRERRRD